MHDLRNTSRPSSIIPLAHKPGSNITCLNIYRDGSKFISRGLDDSMKLWDIR